MHDEEELVRRAQAGDAEAFGVLYERYFDRVYRYVAFRLGKPVEAEDVAEDVFLKALESLDRFTWRGVPFVAWLFRIAANLVVDHVRRQARRQTTPVDDVTLVSEHDPAVEAERRLAAAELAQAIRHLTDLQQQVVTLRFAGGLSIAETAGMLGKTEGAIKAAQHAALGALHRLLVQEDRKRVHEPTI